MRQSSNWINSFLHTALSRQIERTTHVDIYTSTLTYPPPLTDGLLMSTGLQSLVTYTWAWKAPKPGYLLKKKKKKKVHPLCRLLTYLIGCYCTIQVTATVFQVSRLIGVELIDCISLGVSAYFTMLTLRGTNRPHVREESPRRPAAYRTHDKEAISKEDACR